MKHGFDGNDLNTMFLNSFFFSANQITLSTRHAALSASQN